MNKVVINVQDVDGAKSIHTQVRYLLNWNTLTVISRIMFQIIWKSSVPTVTLSLAHTKVLTRNKVGREPNTIAAHKIG